ncbi:MAG: hypothetical protein HY898_18805 [Deltaproteobacteria bacterium]|nr:hypothetical protein [Deltaproteobacteria bacterium]
MDRVMAGCSLWAAVLVGCGAAPVAAPEPAAPVVSAPGASSTHAGNPAAPSSPLAAGACASDADCHVSRVFTCTEILNCSSACQGAGHDEAVANNLPEPAQPSCGPQPPCTPACPAFPPGALEAQAARAVCNRGRCVLSASRGP